MGRTVASAEAGVGAVTTQAMAQAFRSAHGDLAERMLLALEAAQAVGGDIRGQQSACMKIVSGDR